MELTSQLHAGVLFVVSRADMRDVLLQRGFKHVHNRLEAARTQKSSINSRMFVSRLKGISLDRPSFLDLLIDTDRVDS